VVFKFSLLEIILFIKDKKYLVLAYEEAYKIENGLQTYRKSLPLSLNLDGNT